MSEAKHTPGPFRRDKSRDDERDVIRDATGCEIATLTHFSLDAIEGNGNLLAAAFDLLEACKDYAYGRKSERRCEAAMMAAIAKAEGRTA